MFEAKIEFSINSQFLTAYGLGKSTFCRALLPPQLQAYYTDSVDLARPDKVERQLTEMDLLNLDEFDRIPEK